MENDYTDSSCQDFCHPLAVHVPCSWLLSSLQALLPEQATVLQLPGWLWVERASPTLCLGFYCGWWSLPLTILLMLVTHLIPQTQGHLDSWPTCITKVSPPQVEIEGDVQTVCFPQEHQPQPHHGMSHGFLGQERHPTPRKHGFLLTKEALSWWRHS